MQTKIDGFSLPDPNPALEPMGVEPRAVLQDKLRAPTVADLAVHRELGLFGREVRKGRDDALSHGNANLAQVILTRERMRRFKRPNIVETMARRGWCFLIWNGRC